MQLKKLISLTLSACVLFSSFPAVGHAAPIPSPVNKQANIPGSVDLGLVNLVSGDLSLPVQLAVAPSVGDLTMEVSIRYSSKIDQSVNTWGYESPTGTTGLGWSLPRRRIVRQPAETGNESDDIFYLVDGGDSSRLVKINHRTAPNNDQIDVFRAVKDVPWTIEHNLTQEQWVIVDDNGIRRSYGGGVSGSAGNLNSQGNSIQWAVRWGNWLGASARTLGQEQFPISWFLESETDSWGNQVLYSYSQDSQRVGFRTSSYSSDPASGQYYTQAVYLQKIQSGFNRRPNGYSINLSYTPKTASSSPDPHQEHTEPDAYQEQYETNLLSSITVNDENGRLQGTVQLQYQTLNTGPLAKELLTTIKRLAPPSGLPYAPPQQFAYYTEADGVRVALNDDSQKFNAANGALYGALKSMTTPEGATVSFTYGVNDISPQAPSRKIAIPRPRDANSSEHPSIYFGPDYVATIWRNGGSKNKIRVQVHQWDGRWRTTDYGLFPVNNGDNPGDFKVVLGQDYFSVFTKQSNNKTNLNLFHRDPNIFSGWRAAGTTISTQVEYDKVVTGSGRDFVALTGGDGYVHMYLWNGQSWDSENTNPSLKKSFSQKSGSNPSYAMAAGSNWILGAQFFVNNSPIYYTLFRFENGEVKTTTLNTTPNTYINYLGGGGKPYFETTNSFALLSLESGDDGDYDHQQIYLASRWDKNFNLLPPDCLSSQLGTDGGFNPSQCLVNLQTNNAVPHATQTDGNAMAVMYSDMSWYQSDDDSKQSFRFNGAGWTYKNQPNDSGDNNYLGLDSFATSVDGKGYFRAFDPNSLSWLSDNSVKTLPPSYDDGNPTRFQRLWSDIMFIESILTMPLDFEVGLAIDLAFMLADTKLSKLNQGSVFARGNAYFVEKNAAYHQDVYGNWNSAGTLISVNDSDGTCPHSSSDPVVLSTSIAMQDPNTKGVCTTVGASNCYQSAPCLKVQETSLADDFIAYIAQVDVYGQTVTGHAGAPPIVNKYRKSLTQPAVRFLKNGGFFKTPIGLPFNEDLDDSVDNGTPQQLVGGNAFVTYSKYSADRKTSYTLDNTPSLFLYRVIADSEYGVNGAIQDYVVSRVAVNDGYNTTYTHYGYDGASAESDASGTTALYNKVTVTPSGDSLIPNAANGYTNHYFINGSAQPAMPLPVFTARYCSPVGVCTDVSTGPLAQVRGLEYMTETYKAGGAVEARTSTNYQIFGTSHAIHFSNVAFSSNAVTTAYQGYYVRPYQTISVLDEVSTTVSNEYNAKGQLSKTTQSSPTGESFATQYQYAWETPPYSNAPNFRRISAVTKTTTFNKSVGGVTVPLSSQIQTFTSTWGAKTDAWMPYQSFTARVNNASFDFTQPDAYNSSQWVQDQKVLLRSQPNGNPLLTLDADQTPVATLYDNSGLRPVASFLNGAPYAWTDPRSQGTVQDAGYYGFETYESVPSQMRISGGTPGGHTGSNAGTSISVITFQPSPSQTYYASVWFKPGSTADTACVGKGPAIACSTAIAVGQWQYIEQTFPGTQGGVFQSSCTGSGCRLDDFLYGPVQGKANASVYDYTDWKLTAELNENGGLVRHLYDNVQHLTADLIATQDPANRGIVQEAVTHLEGFNYSLSASTSFLPTAPNAKLSIAARSGGDYWPSAPSATLVPKQSGNYGVRFQPQWLGTNVTVALGNLAVKYGNGSYSIVSNPSQTVLVSTRAAAASDWTVFAQDQWMFFFADGRFLLSAKNPQNTAITGNVTLSPAPGSVTYTNTLLFYDPIVNVTYFDGLRRPVQSVMFGPTVSSGNVISGTLYDGWGQPAIQLMPAQRTDDPNLGFGFYPNLYNVGGGTFDWNNGMMDGLVKSYYSANPLNGQSGQDAAYSYWRTTTFPSPLARASAAGSPGQNFSVSGPYNVAYTYSGGSNLHTTQASYPYQTPNIRSQHTTTRDAFGRQVRLTGGNINMQSFTGYSYAYNSSGQLTTTVSQPNAFDTANHPSDAQSFRSTVVTDVMGNVVSRTSPDQGATLYKYAPMGKLRFLADAQDQQKNRTAYWKYDALGRVVEEGMLLAQFNSVAVNADNPDYPDSSAANKFAYGNYAYDLSGATSYNAKGRLTQATYNNYTWDPTPSYTSQVQKKFSYDLRGNVVATSQVLNSTPTQSLFPSVAEQSLQYQYDNLGNVTRLDYPDSFSVVYGYDPLGRIKSVGTPQTPDYFSSYAYDVSGRMAAQSLSKGGDTSISRRYGYNFQGRLVSINDAFVGPTSSNFFTETINYNNSSGQYQDGNPARIQINAPQGQSSDVSYQYDPLGRLSSVSNASQGMSSTLRYDANGNILSNGATTYTYALRTNQIASVIGKAYTFLPNGLLSGASNDSLTYDPFRNRLQSLSSSDGSKTAAFLHADQRIYKTYNPNDSQTFEKHYYMHGLSPMPLYEIAATYSNEAPVKSPLYHVYGPDGLVSTRINGIDYFYSKDHLGSTRVVSSGAETPMTFSYDAYGKTSATTVDAPPDAFLRYRYTGQEQDAEIGLYNYRARLYDPALRRFLEPDPVNTGLDPYLYVENNPLSFTDPTGLIPAAKLAKWAKRAMDAGLAAGFPERSAESAVIGLAKARRNGNTYLLATTNATSRKLTPAMETYLRGKAARRGWTFVPFSGGIKAMKQVTLSPKKLSASLEFDGLGTVSVSAKKGVASASLRRLDGVEMPLFEMSFETKIGYSSYWDHFGSNVREAEVTLSRGKAPGSITFKIQTYYHAEVNLKRFANQFNLEVRKVGASKDACSVCHGYLDSQHIPHHDTTGLPSSSLSWTDSGFSSTAWPPGALTDD